MYGVDPSDIQMGKGKITPVKKFGTHQEILQVAFRTESENGSIISEMDPVGVRDRKVGARTVGGFERGDSLLSRRRKMVEGRIDCGVSG